METMSDKGSAGSVDVEGLPLSDTAVEALMWLGLVLSWPFMAYSKGLFGLLAGVTLAMAGLFLAVIIAGRRQVRQGVVGMGVFLVGSALAFAVRYAVLV